MAIETRLTATLPKKTISMGNPWERDEVANSFARIHSGGLCRRRVFTGGGTRDVAG